MSWLVSCLDTCVLANVSVSDKKCIDSITANCTVAGARSGGRTRPPPRGAKIELFSTFVSLKLSFIYASVLYYSAPAAKWQAFS